MTVVFLTFTSAYDKHSLQTRNFIDILLCNFVYFERQTLSNIFRCNRKNFEIVCLNIGSLVFVTDPTVGLISSVDIAISYGLDGPEFDGLRGKIFLNRPDRPWSPASLLYNG
jgi:hypothetical protein